MTPFTDFITVKLKPFPHVTSGAQIVPPKGSGENQIEVSLEKIMIR